MKDDVHRDGYIYQGMPSHYLERRRAANSANFFTPHLAPGMTVLDCGCGPGTISPIILPEPRLFIPGGFQNG